MAAELARRTLTDLIITTIAGVTVRPVGDGIVPPGGGWQGQPNASGSNFVPYNVVQTGIASYSSGPFGDSQADWRVPYVVWGFGVKRNQCEAICDLARSALSGLRGTQISLGDQTYSVQQVRTETIGAVTRFDQLDPPYWGQNDTVTLWISKEF